MTRKILYSPGWGAGWSSWNEGEVAKFMLEYQPIIEFLEGGGSFKYKECGGPSRGDDAMHPILKQMCAEIKEKFGKDYVCCLGADDLEVAYVEGLVRIKEYDGNESYVVQGQDEGWM
jgi:hypothetical protein